MPSVTFYLLLAECRSAVYRYAVCRGACGCCTIRNLNLKSGCQRLANAVTRRIMHERKLASSQQKT